MYVMKENTIKNKLYLNTCDQCMEKYLYATGILLLGGTVWTEQKGFGMICYLQFSSVQFSHSAVSDSLQPHELQHARPPCPSPTPGVHSDSRPSSQRCHPAISSSVIRFSSCPQSLPASESFPMNQLFT